MKSKKKAARRAPKKDSTAEDLQELYEWLSDGWTEKKIPQRGRFLLLLAVPALMEGCDPREVLGISPKIGRPTRRGSRDRWLSGHYWALRLQARKMHKAATGIVADAWNVGPDMVYKISRPRRSEWTKLIDSGAFENMLKVAPKMASLLRSEVYKSR